MTLIDWLLAPITTETFLHATWEREVLHVSRTDRDHFGSLFGLDDLDRLLSNTAFPTTNLNLAKDGTPIDAGEYAVGAFVDATRVLSLHADGATIILRALEQWHRELGQLCRAATHEFGTRSQVNVYATPPGNRSTPPHWDTHDLFILQIHGEKLWNLYENPDDPLPLESERFRGDVYKAGPLIQEVLLRPGDVLYLPRGTIHEPQADSYSIHVSLGIVPNRISDVMADVVRLAAANLDELRRAIPPTAADTSDLAVENAVMAALRSVVNRDLVRAALSQRRQSIAGDNPDVSGRLRSIASQ